ncbi:MAG: DUF3810 domain-containing protein [Flavobacteriaceae bacterium]|nr:DUF3810 domain-containing protein [Flavobacteriaceae bacterium]
MKNKKHTWFWVLFLPIQWFAVQILSNIPAFIEEYYSTGLFPITVKFQRILLGWIPFSIGDVLYVIAVYLIIKSIVNAIRKRKIGILRITATISIVYFVFQLSWGLNYLREPIHKTFNISELNYTTEELNVFTLKLVETINKTQFEITQNDSLKVSVPYTRKEIYTKVNVGYNKLSQLYPELIYKNESIKHSLLSYPLSYMGFSGYINPFTGEAQVNSLNPLVTYPSTSCHEVAHQLGFAAENEANFIGFLTAINNDDIYFQYSGYYMALRYALNELYIRDKEKYKFALKELNKGVLINMKETQEYWQQFQNPLEPYFKSIFNQYLKANKLTEGIKNYNLMLGLLINYEKNKQINLFIYD